MATRTGSKQGRPTGKTAGKTLGKDQTKGDKQTANVLEIVPGKFNETDWLSLLENDDTEDFIADIFEEIWTETSKQIQQIYIRRRLLPFTLMMTENALSNVLQWAFLERDEPKPASSNFWSEDSEPIPSTMDNWGEGVVPACREERPQSLEEPLSPIAERPSTAPPIIPNAEDVDRAQRPLTGSSITSSVQTPLSQSRLKRLPRMPPSNSTPSSNQQTKSIKTDSDDRILTQKDSSTEQTTSRSSFEPRPYYHDVLVIQTQPPKLEPLSDLFYPPQTATKSTSFQSTPMTTTAKRPPKVPTKSPSQLGTETLVSTTNITETATTKSYKKLVDTRPFDDQHIEEVIAKAPAAAHSMLKSILSRPTGYRELELDEHGNVIAMAKLDPDRIPPRSIQVKCDLIKQRKHVVETRPPPVKMPQKEKSERPEPKFAAVKLVLPEQSTDIGDLIQPVPGVFYEDSRLKKGDPRRYQTGVSKYTNFHDETRPLKPIAQRTDLEMLRAATDFLRQTNATDTDNDNDEQRDPQIPKLHRLAPIPPIISGTNATSA